MEVEQLPFADTTLGRRIIQVGRGVVTAASAARDAYKLQARARAMPPNEYQREAQGLVSRVVAAGQAARSTPSRVELGAWKAFDALHAQNPALQAALRTREAREARTTAGAGIEPQAYAPYPELTACTIADSHRRADATGWVDRKIDIDNRYLRFDSHVRGCDSIRRAPSYKAPFRVVPRSSSPLGLLTASAVRASWEHLENFRPALGALGVQGMVGFACAELKWKTTRLSIPVGKRRIVVDTEVVDRLDEVFPRNIVFDIVTDEPWLCLGAGSYVRIQEPGLQKFLFMAAAGDGPIRWRGWGWANSWLSLLGGMSLSRFGVVVEQFGLSTPTLTRNGSGYLTDEQHAHALKILESIGTGEPAIIEEAYGKLDYSPVPSNLAPLHAQCLGVIKSEQSKVILSSTLQMEMSPSGVGSYAAAGTHRDQQTDIQTVDHTLYASAIQHQPFRWICEANAEAWASAFSRYIPGGCRPEDVIAETPGGEFVISDETPAQRLSIFQGVVGLKMEVDPDQVREELGVRAPLPQLDELVVDADDAGVSVVPAAEPPPAPEGQHADP